jgi:ketosteroid isomerase-like protein
MDRRISITAIARALLFSVVVLLAGNGTTYAQQSDTDKIKAAIEAFHAAIDGLDMSKMDPLWVHDVNVTNINPGDKIVSVGWDAVKKGFEANGPQTFWSELKLTEADGPYIQIKGDVAWATGFVNGAGKTKAGNALTAHTTETSVFEKSGGAWLLVSHTASRMPQ